jgi:hypothetical protein
MRFGQGCACGGFNTKIFYLGSYSTKTPSFGAGIGIATLNVQLKTSGMARPILVISSSNDASPQKKFDCKDRTAKICFLGVIAKKSPKGSFPAKLLHSITF